MGSRYCGGFRIRSEGDAVRPEVCRVPGDRQDRVRSASGSGCYLDAGGVCKALPDFLVSSLAGGVIGTAGVGASGGRGLWRDEGGAWREGAEGKVGLEAAAQAGDSGTKGVEEGEIGATECFSGVS